jgi:hypothetical protein
MLGGDRLGSEVLGVESRVVRCLSGVECGVVVVDERCEKFSGKRSNTHLHLQVGTEKRGNRVRIC